VTSKDVTSVNTVLQQCTGKVARLNIQLEIACSTADVESQHYHGTAISDGAINFVSEGTETEGTGHFTL